MACSSTFHPLVNRLLSGATGRIRHDRERELTTEMDGYAIGDGRRCRIREPSEVVARHRTTTASAAESPVFLIRVEAHPRHP
jgi:hypothetical protein